jgi:O-antigen/teichoic acid export membrane protein
MSDNKRFAINMIAQIVAFVVNLGIGFFLTPYIVKHVGKEAFGFFGLALNFVSYAQLITVALNSMASRYITISIHQNDIPTANKYFTSVFYANIVFSAILSVVFLFLIIYLNAIINIPARIDTDVKLLFSFIFFNFIISIITSVYGVATFAKNRLDLSSIRSIISNIIKIGTLFFCFAFFSPNVWYIGFASVLTSVYLYYTNFRLTNQLVPELKISKKYIDLQKIKELIKSGIWNTLSKLSGILNIGLDLLIANLFIGSSAMGTLSLAKSIPSIILSIFVVLASVYAPNLTTAFALKKHDEINQQLLSSMKFMGFLSSIPIAILFAYGDVFFKLWVPGEDSSLIHILSIFTCLELCFALPQEGLWNIFTVTNKVKTTSINLFLMSSLTITTVFIAMHVVNINNRIYYLGAITSLFGIIRLVTFLPIYGAKCLHLKWTTFYPILIKNFISIIILTIISLIIKRMTNPDSWFSLIGIVVFTTILGFVINNYLILNRNEREFLLDKTIKKVLKR